MISRNIKMEATLSAAEVAQEFCELDSEGMALFFNAVATFSNEWKAPFCFQLQGVTDEVCLTDEGRYIMSQIGEYSSKVV